MPTNQHYTIICGGDEEEEEEENVEKKRNNKKQIYMNLCVSSIVAHVKQCFKYIFYVESIIYSLGVSVCLRVSYK